MIAIYNTRWLAWSLLLGCALLCAAPAEAFLTGYGDRISITCGGQNSPASSLTAFTCIVRLSDNAAPGGDLVPSFNYAHVQKSATCGPSATGTNCDVRFTDTSDVELPFKIENWNGGTDSQFLNAVVDNFLYDTTARSPAFNHSSAGVFGKTIGVP
ncbi:MAG TPA: hypothetical protein VF515_11735 [Candidatus Binatia bacterium]